MDRPDFESVLRRRVLGDAPGADAAWAARRVAELGAGSVAAIVFFGSQRTRAQPGPYSAYDFFVVTRDDASFYRALHAARALHRGPRLLALVGRVLAPSQVSLRLAGERGALHVKASVLPLPSFRRETSPRRRDHFCLARLFQPTSLLHAADEGVREEVLGALGAAHRFTFDWARPWLPAEFDAPDYARTLLEVSLRSEIRPETAGRARALYEAQRDYHDEVYAALLEELCRAGRLERVGERRFRLAQAVTAAERRRVRRYFARSLARATLRWAKHMLTFEGWREYIVRKIERRLGQPLRPRERRHPLIFLWPRLFRHVCDRYRPPR